MWKVVLCSTHRRDIFCAIYWQNCYTSWLTTRRSLRLPRCTWRAPCRGGLAITQAVIRPLATEAAQVRCGICSGQSDIGARFIPILRFPLPVIDPIHHLLQIINHPSIPHHIVSITDLKSRPRHRLGELQLHPYLDGGDRPSVPTVGGSVDVSRSARCGQEKNRFPLPVIGACSQPGRHTDRVKPAPVHAWHTRNDTHSTHWRTSPKMNGQLR
jgi:hypothetical protein